MLSSNTFLSESVSFEDARTVHPWNHLIAKICDEIDNDTFQKLFFLLKDKLEGKYEEISSRQDYFKFFSTLEDRLGSEDVVTAIENGLQSAKIHDSAGFSLAETIRQYKKEVKTFKEEVGHTDVFIEPNFIGRTSLLHEVQECLKNYKGVILCGLSGMGKTSLAKKALLTLPQKASKYKWKITYINQREKKELKDLLLDMVYAFREAEKDDLVSMATCDTSELRSCMLQLLSCQEMPQNHIIFIDNLDGHCDTSEKKDKLMKLLSMMMDSIELTPRSNSPVTRLLLTLGPMMSSVSDPSTDVRNKRFDGQVMEMSIGRLNDAEATDVLRQVSNHSKQSLPDSDCSRLTAFCQGYPMALNTVGKMLKDGLTVDEVLIHSSFNASPVLSAPVEACLQRSIAQLTNDKFTRPLTQLLIQLCVFQSAPFDIQAAMAMTCGRKDVVGSSHGKKSPERDVLKFQLKKLKEHHLLEIEHGEISGYTNKKDKDQMYSIHPIVNQYLQSIIEEAKDLHEVYEDAKVNFVHYFYAQISEYGKASDKAPLKAKRRFDNHSVHVKRFFNLVQEKKLSIFELQKNYLRVKSKSKPTSLIMAYRALWKVANLTIVPKQRIQFCQEQVMIARKERNFFIFLYWKCLECEDCIVLDRLEMAARVLDDVNKDLHAEANGSEVIGSEFGILATDWKCNEEEKVASLAKYYEVKGRVCRGQKKLGMSLECLCIAEKLYRGVEVANLIVVKRGKQKLYDPSLYRRELAAVKNLFGCVYFELKDFDQSLKFHQEAYGALPEVDTSFWHEDKTEYLHNIASVYHQLGLRTKVDHQQRDHFHKALEIYSKCVKLNKNVGRHVSTSQAHTLRSRAGVYYQQGDFNKALDDAESSLDIFRKLVQPPHVDLTRTISKKAFVHWKLAERKKQEYDNEGANLHFNTCLELFNSLLKNHIIRGGLPLTNSSDDQNSVLFRDIKKKHLKVMEICDSDSRTKQRLELLYQKFEQGQFDKQIQQRSDFATQLAKMRAEGQMVTLVPCSDDSDSDSEDSESSETDTSPSTSRSTSCRSSVSMETSMDGEYKARQRDSDLHDPDDETEAGIDIQMVRQDNFPENSECAGVKRKVFKASSECESELMEPAEDDNLTEGKGETVEDVIEMTSKTAGIDDDDIQVQMRRKRLARQESFDEPKKKEAAELYLNTPSSSQWGAYRPMKTSTRSLEIQTAGTPDGLSTIGEAAVFESSTTNQRRNSEAPMVTVPKGNRLSSGYWSGDSGQQDSMGSFESRRRSWQASSLGSEESLMGSKERREKWQSSGSQNSVTSQFELLLNLTTDSFDADEDGPASKKKKI